MNASQLINQDSGNVEYYTPPEPVEAARALGCMIISNKAGIDIALSEIPRGVQMTTDGYRALPN